MGPFKTQEPKTPRPRIEVAEWERLGTWSRVQILNVSGVSRHDERQVRDLVGEWIPTHAVEWRAVA